MASFAPSSERPMLPSLRTLGLLSTFSGNCLLRSAHAPYEYNEQSCPRNIATPSGYHTHQMSFSSPSPTTRTPSPMFSQSPAASRPASAHSPSQPPTQKLRLIPSTLEVADAVVLVPPRSAPVIPALASQGAPRAEGTQQGQALLLIGDALERVRGPNSKVAKGASIHPYRIFINAKDIQRPSGPSVSSV